MRSAAATPASGITALAVYVGVGSPSAVTSRPASGNATAAPASPTASSAPFARANSCARPSAAYAS